MLLLAGCGSAGSQTSVSTAPEQSGAAVDSDETQPKSAELTEQAIAEISKLGASPDDNYRTWYVRSKILYYRSNCLRTTCRSTNCQNQFFIIIR